MFILTEQTPNPAAMKFIPHCVVTSDPAQAFRRVDHQAGRSPLADRLFELPAVDGVFIAHDFVTVTRAPDGPPWSVLRLEAIAALADHLASGAPAVIGSAPSTAISGGEIEDEILGVLGLYVRPGVARDGGDVVFDRFDPDTGVLWIEMRGACGGCPSSQMTLKTSIETIVRRYVPEVKRVEATAAAEDAAPSRLRTWMAKLKGVKSQGARPVFTHNGEPAASDLAPPATSST
ncbi:MULTISPECIES: NifU family protein [unclassified Caulobacter]|uniref:NifU family protein n=1 Tax=unclassified Caulobacter TaxID=2648921 RepID=UPI0009E831A5|nr:MULTISPECIES: NifU family protein [unclassified Caulobacter]